MSSKSRLKRLLLGNTVWRKEKVQIQTKNKQLESKKGENKEKTEDSTGDKEIEDILEDVPLEETEAVMSMIRRVTHSSLSVSNEPPSLTKMMEAVGDKLTSEHITQIFGNSDKSDKRGFLHSILNRIIIGIVIIAVIAAFLIVLKIFSNDTETALEIIRVGVIALGGLGGGIGISSRLRK